jgi:hypothetical protein
MSLSIVFGTPITLFERLHRFLTETGRVGNAPLPGWFDAAEYLTGREAMRVRSDQRSLPATTVAAQA